LGAGQRLRAAETGASKLKKITHVHPRKSVGEVVDVNPRIRTDWLVLAGFCGFLFFYGLAYFGLVGADEPRYAQVAREMLAHHDWITPTLDGKPWLEKPPLYYWQAMLAYRLFGVSDWAARLPSPVDATLMVIAIYLFFRRFRPGSQLDAALMTVSAAGIIGFARAASTDMPLAAAFTIAMLAWYAWHESGAPACLWLAYAFLALGMLAKGPVAPFLALLIISIFAIVRHDYKIIRRTFSIPGILIFCLIAVPWYIAVQLRNPDFFHAFILQHNLERFSSNLYHHREPFWYYIPVVLLALLPWTVFAVAALAETIRAWWSELGKMLKSEAAQEDALNLFLLIWLVVPVVFFSISQSKLPGYILPALPAAALLLAEYVRRHVAANHRPSAVALILHAVVAAGLVAPALLLGQILLLHHIVWSTPTLIALTIAPALAIGMVLTLRMPTGLRMLRFVTLIPVILAIAAVLRLYAPALDATLSARPLAIELGKLASKPLPLAVFHVRRETEFGLAFYRNQIIDRYEAGQIPPEEHIVFIPTGSRQDLMKQLAGRRVLYLGSFAPQRLDYYWISAQTPTP
jgi:4-amino-4-deoxy-L-arabinose transferase-like glycosyltransferase